MRNKMPPAGYEGYRLAVLIASPHQGETPMHHDLAAMYDALRERGLAPEEILSLEGRLCRGMLAAFLQEVRKELAVWNRGEVLFYYTGHGHRRGAGADAEAMMWLNSDVDDEDSSLSWEEMFSTLDVPAGVRLIVLPDS